MFFVNIKPGHDWVLQVREELLDPGQFCPPLDGAGLLHFLVLLLTPRPHDLEQVDQLPQEPQLPFLTVNCGPVSDVTPID